MTLNTVLDHQNSTGIRGRPTTASWLLLGLHLACVVAMRYCDTPYWHERLYLQFVAALLMLSTLVFPPVYLLRYVRGHTPGALTVCHLGLTFAQAYLLALACT